MSPRLRRRRRRPGAPRAAAHPRAVRIPAPCKAVTSRPKPRAWSRLRERTGASELLALRTYTARLLGADPSLVLHGGGNTSVKAQAKTLLGETVDVLYVKGSGWDLATIEPPGHPAVRLAPLLGAPRAPGDDRRADGQRASPRAPRRGAPTPSVETLLHAALPARFIDHTHADARARASSISPTPSSICREIFGDALLFVPYVMPGFGLASACKEAWDGARRARPRADRDGARAHGIFTFGATAKESYERMIDAVTLAERLSRDRSHWTASFPAGRRRRPTIAAQVAPARPR